MATTSGSGGPARCDAEIIQSERQLKEEVRRLRETLRLRDIQATKAERAMIEGRGLEYIMAGYREADRLASSLRHLVATVGYTKAQLRRFFACL